jgi:prepilin-type N-terminal cleavage/methylation domain-containing protein
MQKVKAFTLMELLVSMLISGIVISIIYLSYEIIYKQYEGYKKTNKKITQALLVNTLLKTDFLKAHYILNKEKGLLFLDKQQNAIGYQFEEKYILRKANNVQDTFFLKAITIKQEFMNLKQEEPFGLVDNLFFEASILDELEQFHFQKTYGADVLMEENIPHPNNF